MKAWSVERPGPIERGPLVLGERPDPKPEANEILVQVTYCGVCRTDLHLAEGVLDRLALATRRLLPDAPGADWYQPGYRQALMAVKATIEPMLATMRHGTSWGAVTDPTLETD